jgi:hypothetical protein
MQRFRQLQNSVQEEKLNVRRNYDKLLDNERSVSESLRQENFALQQRLHEMLHIMSEAAASENDEFDQNVSFASFLV